MNEISQEAAREMRDVLDEFCRRVECGEVQSRHTYNRAKNAIAMAMGNWVAKPTPRKSETNRKDP